MTTSESIQLVATAITAATLIVAIIALYKNTKLQNKTNNIYLYNEKMKVLKFFKEIKNPEDKLNIYVDKCFYLNIMQSLFSKKLTSKFKNYINKKDLENKFKSDNYKALLQEMEDEINKSIS